MLKTSAFLLAGGLCLLGSGTASAQAAHDPNHLSAFEQICIAAHGSEDFCACTRQAVESHLPPEHASFTAEALIVDDLPDDVALLLEEATLDCRDRHIDFTGEHHPNHLSAFEQLCMTAHDNDAFCTCARQALEEHLPPAYASFRHEGLIRDDLPEEIAVMLDDMVLECRDTHVEFEDDTIEGDTTEGDTTEG